MAKLIERMTPEQEFALVAYRQEWLDLGRSTKPIDQIEVEGAVTAIYAQIDKPKPLIVHCLSPFSMACMPSMYRAIGKMASNLEQPQLESQLWSQLGSQLESQLWSQLGSQLRSQLESQLRSQLGSQLGSQLESQLWSQLESQLWSQLGSQLESDAKNDMTYWSGMFSWYYPDWLAWIDFPARTFPEFKYNEKQYKQWQEWIALAKAVHGFLPFDGICFVSDRPNAVHVDEQGRLHCENGPAVLYADTYSYYSWHGVRIDWEKAHIIEKPETITVSEIEQEGNAEVRRVMVERFGTERYIMESGAKPVHTDITGTLYRKEQANDEPLVMVKVRNSTPEPDGSIRDYFLRVPPTIERARQGVAWTFSKEEHEYDPRVQT
jgi:hypothetical protein